MLARQPGPYGDVARKWHALAARRQAHVEELRDSGRWRHYYDWEELIEALREATATRQTWARLAGLAQDETQNRAQDGAVAEISGSSEAVAAGTAEDWLEAQLFRKAG
jgi:hypothetical protein